MKKRKIVYVTGSRAEYSVMRGVLKAIDSDKDFNLSLIVTGSHLMKEFGYTIKDIITDKLKIVARVDMKIKGTPEADAKSVGYAILGITDALVKIKPNLLLIAGDRVEELAAAISASRLRIPIIHQSGGDISGHIIDESTRHAITKLSHIHLAETRRSAKRIIKMGEERSRVFFVGNPSLEIKRLSKEAIAKVCRRIGLNPKIPFAILLYHATPLENSGRNIKTILEIIAGMKMQTVAIYPNVDPGCADIIKQIERYSKRYPFIKVVKNFSHELFAALMQGASMIIGNSSGALFEGTSYKLPVINVGFRQERRERAINVIDVKRCNKSSVIRAVNKAQSTAFKRKIARAKNPYYLRNSKERIIQIIKSLELDSSLLLKKTTL